MRSIKAVFFAGFLVGTLDIIAAFVDYYIITANGPAGVLRFIASGVFGNEAFKGSSIMIWWGLFFHYLIAFGLTGFFFWLYSRIKSMAEYPVSTAIVYSIFMWIVTTQVIMPLSNTPPMPFEYWKAVKAILILLFMMGLPLSFIAKRQFNPEY